MDHPSLRREPLHQVERASLQPTLAHTGGMPEHHDSDEHERESLVEEYMRILMRHKLLILSCAAGGLLLAMLLGLTTQPIYRTRTSLDIRSLNADFMNLHNVAQTGGGSADEASTNLQTQIKLLESDTLMEQVGANLMAAPHPESVPQQDLLSRMERAMHVGGRKQIAYAALVSDATARVKVKPLGLTRLVEVTCDSWDAEFSAKFCNTLTSTYEQQDLKTRADEALKTQEWLTRQVSDVRDRAEDSRKKLDQAVGGNGLMLSQTSTSAGEERLRSLQDELVKAQADRMQKEADAGVARTATPESLPGVQDNPAHRAYELKLADLRSQLTQLVPTLTEQNPRVMKLRAQIADAESGLRATETSSTSRQTNEFSAARHREALLDVAYKAQQASVSADLQRAEQVSLLRKEVDSEQQLYQTMLQRAKEAGFASAMQAATIRVIDAARVPRFAASPRRTLSAALGLFLGALGGLAASFFRDRNNKVFRIPGDVSRFLHVDELGVIPAAKAVGAGSFGLVRHKPAAQAMPYGNEITLTRWDDNFSIGAEAYRNATLSILLADSAKRTRSYVLSSPNVAEGKTTVTSNIGVALSKSRLRVVLIDGDLRRPNLHNAFALKNDYGLRNILRGEVDLEITPTDVLTRSTFLSGVSVIPAGRGDEDIVELLHSSYFGALLARLSRDFDVILIDSPPVLHMADARILASYSDGAILVFRAGLTTREQAATARDLFAKDGVRLVGTILNDFDPAAEGKPDYYSSYYRYGKQDSAEEVGAGV